MGNKGFGMLTALASMVILSIVSLAAMKQMSHLGNASAQLSSKLEFNSLGVTVDSLISSPELCLMGLVDSQSPRQSASFFPADYTGSLSASRRQTRSLAAIQLGSSLLAHVGSKVGNTSLETLKLVEVDPAARTPLSSGNTQYALQIQLTTKAGKAFPLQKKLNVFAELDSNYQIKRCSRVAAGSGFPSTGNPVGTVSCSGSNEVLTGIDFNAMRPICRTVASSPAGGSGGGSGGGAPSCQYAEFRGPGTGQTTQGWTPACNNFGDRMTSCVVNDAGSGRTCTGRILTNARGYDYCEPQGCGVATGYWVGVVQCCH